MMRIAVWRGDFQASFLYRLGLPLNAAFEQGLAEVAFVDYDVPLDSDVLVAQRLMSPEQAEYWHQAEAPLKVLEYDDDLLHLRADNGMVRSIGSDVYRREWVPAMEAALASADLVTVSVPHLAERFRQYTDATIAVLPNTVHGSLHQVKAPLREPGQALHLGWAGTTTHEADWRACASGIDRGLRATGAELTLVGGDYRSTLRHPATLRPWSDTLPEYYSTIADFHVMLAPLEDDAFNRSKSPIKALEAAALGIPTIASAAGPYLDFVEDGETGFLCRTRSDWERAIRTLSNDEELRRRLGQNARTKAATLITSRWAPRWVETYQAALNASAQPA